RRPERLRRRKASKPICFLAVYSRAIDGAPLIVAANREESYARGGTPPQLLVGTCQAVAGIDPIAGGSWLGVNQRGVLVAVTNRPKSKLPAQPRSRGLLLRELLTCCDPKSAVELAARELGRGRFSVCILLCAGRE